jgi:general secretion pathway protein K
VTAAPGRGPAAGQRGIALLLVVWLLALLAVIAGEFMASGRVKYAAEANKRDDLRALALALAGYRQALAALDEDVTGLALDEDEALLLISAAAPEGVKAAAGGVALADGSFSWSIRSEDGLVNLNTENSRSVLGGVLKACGMGPGAERDTVIDSIADWRDTNREHQLNGAEEDYYRSLPEPYSCKDGPFDVVEELLLVRGVTPELFWGRTEAGTRRPGLRDLLSPYAEQFIVGTAPEAVREAMGGREGPPAKPPQSTNFEILASGSPSGGAPPRRLRAVVRRVDKDGSREFTLLYWNDSYFPPVSEREGVVR